VINIIFLIFGKVPESSGMFHVPDFVDGHFRLLSENTETKIKFLHSLGWKVRNEQYQVAVLVFYVTVFPVTDASLTTSSRYSTWIFTTGGKTGRKPVPRLYNTSNKTVLQTSEYSWGKSWSDGEMSRWTLESLATQELGNPVLSMQYEGKYILSVVSQVKDLQGL